MPPHNPKVNAVKKLLKTEHATRSMHVKLADNTVKVSATVRPDGNTSDRYQMEFTLDFTNASPEEMFELASRSAIIAYQAQWRRAKEAYRMDASKWERTIDVKAEILDAERRSADPMAKMLTLMNKLSDDEKEAIRKALTR